MRQCGDCQLCCRLVPVPPLGKPAGQRCRHQKFGKGCGVYHTPKMPIECGVWNCRWLVGDDTADLPRPDRAHLVIDIVPDFISVQNNETGEIVHRVQVVQIWCDPRYPEAHRDPRLRSYLLRRGEQGIGAIVRFNSKDALTIIPPNLASDGAWHEVTGQATESTHSFADVLDALA
jgi:hypothetical protein